jgi:hypothetical protein
VTVRSAFVVDPIEGFGHSVLREHDRQRQRTAKKRHDEPRADAALRSAATDPYDKQIREGRDCENEDQ